MLTLTKKIVKDVAKHLSSKQIKPVIKVANHFEERMIERFDAMVRKFDEKELAKFERAIEKALEKLPVKNKAQTYVHPTFGIAIVAKKLGQNYLELVTCYKKEIIC